MVGRVGFLRNFDVVNININLCWPTWMANTDSDFPNISMLMHLADFLRLS